MTHVVAIVAAYNEADVIAATTRDLIDQGVEVYLLDHGSTDGTADAVRDLLGHGLLSIERFEPESTTFQLRRLMARKQELAATLSADWIVNHDADELRESPWRGVPLPRALELVDRLGFNAVDFAVLNFPPINDNYRPGDDLRLTFPFYERGARYDAVQVRCWKRQPAIDLQHSGGHDVQFPGRRVFPVRFLLRHYPIRSQAQGERKVFQERVPRFSPDERQMHWHVQYDGLTPGSRFVRDPATLRAFDADLVRAELQLEHRGLEEANSGRQKAEQQTARWRAELDAVRTELDAVRTALASAQRRVDELENSVSWRATAPLRWGYDRLRGL